MTKYVFAGLASLISLSLMWLGDSTMDRAQEQAASTFQIPTGTIALGLLAFGAAGAAMATVLMIRAKRDRRFGYLLTGLAPPAIVIAYLLMAYEGWVSIPDWAEWIGSGLVQGACAFAVGAMLANLVWRATGPKRFEDPGEGVA